MTTRDLLNLSFRCLQKNSTVIYRHFNNADIMSVSGFKVIFTVPLTLS